jgi:hypothetical protein
MKTIYQLFAERGINLNYDTQLTVSQLPVALEIYENTLNEVAEYPFPYEGRAMENYNFVYELIQDCVDRHPEFDYNDLKDGHPFSDDDMDHLSYFQARRESNQNRTHFLSKL